MTRITREQFASLRKDDPLVFAYIYPASRLDADGKSINVHESKIAQGPLHDDARERFLAWVKNQEDAAKDAARQQELNAQTEALNKRIGYWLGQGMLNTEANAKVLLNFVDSHPQFSRVQMTPALLDAAIEMLHRAGRLEWRTEPVAPAPTPQPEPEPVILPDGKPQLHIDTPVSTRYSVEQLRDLDRRRRARDAGESESLPPLPSGRPRLPFGTKPNAAKHADDQIRDLESRTARVWAGQTGSHGASWFSSDSQVI